MERDKIVDNKIVYNCIVVDDEILARKLLAEYISHIPELNLIASCKGGIEAITTVNSEEVDIMFLDINMPDITGLELLKSVKAPPIVIMTTAYSEYAMEGFELNVFDYLLKPIPLPKFMSSVLKAIDSLNNSRKERVMEKSPTLDTIQKNYLTVKADHKLYKINYSDIKYIEGQREYVTFHTTKRKITAFYTLKNLEEILPISQFIRIHKSYISSIQHIETLDGNILEVAGSKLPIGKSYKAKLMTLFNN